MNEAVAGGAGGASAGRLLKQAREAQGLHLAALASAIKVSPQKLELLEADRYDQLLDATFTRALAQTICRSLKIDAAPVLALLPRPGANRLGDVGQNLNAPFYEAQGPATGSDWSGLARPAVWGPLLLLVIAAGVYLMPHGWLGTSETRRATPRDPLEPTTSSTVAPRVGTVVETVRSAGVPDATAPVPVPAPSESLATPSMPIPAPAPAPAPAAAAPKLLQVHVSAQSWVEVIDVRGQSLLSRVVQPGENVELDGTVPLKVKIGNAAATALVFRGQALELAPFTRDNLARLELK
ncbi:MAG: helix-turn-helix domain-containing protein [Caldimonas sp.]